MNMREWHMVRGFSVGSIMASLLNIVLIPMNKILWAWFGINTVLLITSLYKIHQLKKRG